MEGNGGGTLGWNGHKTPNTIGFSTPLRAPAFYWHIGNPFPPPMGYVNLKDKIDALIGRIKMFNVESGSGGMVLFHTEGDRKTWGWGWHHCWAQWREFYTKPGQPDQFLHLIDERRVGCFMKVFKYFLHQTPFNSESAPPSPNPNQQVAFSPTSSVADTAPEVRSPGEAPEESREIGQNTRAQCVTAEMSKAKGELDKRRRRKKVKSKKVKGKQAPASNVDKGKEPQNAPGAAGEIAASAFLEGGESREGECECVGVCNNLCLQILDESD